MSLGDECELRFDSQRLVLFGSVEAHDDERDLSTRKEYGFDWSDTRARSRHRQLVV
jgi:hypothetical protein